MNLDELQSVRDRERQTDKLQQLRETFYADAGEFIQQLREQRERAAERADDPFDAPEVNRLSDEIDTAEQTVEAIYEKRVGKIVKAASFAAADLPAESDGMTAEETELFETLVADIKDNRQHVLDVLAGEAEPGTASSDPEQSSSEPTDAGSATPESHAPPDVIGGDGADEVSAADAMGSEPDTGTDRTDSSVTDDSPDLQAGAGGDRPTPPDGDGESASAAGDRPVESESEAVTTAPSSGSAASEGTESEPDVRKDGGTATGEQTGVERETVRITADVGGIFGVDEREYDLSTDDVVTLPAANVGPLVERDAAERL